ncbi:MAG: hypothetical protein K6A05_00585 [Lachnospiraceae bacterium]|nr:hypothetical protein [Lachnospiraceae bacterium]
MDWAGMIINLVAIALGLGVYIGIMNSKFGKEHVEYQYAIMLGTIILACLFGGLLRVLGGMIMGM